MQFTATLAGLSLGSWTRWGAAPALLITPLLVVWSFCKILKVELVRGVGRFREDRRSIEAQFPVHLLIILERQKQNFQRKLE